MAKDVQIDPAEVPSAAESALTLDELGVSFDSGSGWYLTEDDKNALLANHVPMLITGIDYDAKNQYGPRFILTVVPATEPDSSTRAWSMAEADKDGRVYEPRSSTIRHLMEAQRAAQGRPVGPVVFYTKGRTTLLRMATPEDYESEALPF